MTLKPGGMDVVVGAGYFALAMEDALATTASRSGRTPCKHSFLQSSTSTSAQAETGGRERTQLIFANSRSLRRVPQHLLVIDCRRVFLLLSLDLFTEFL